MKHTVIGMDIAKRVFQLHAIDRQTGEIERIKLTRAEVFALLCEAYALAGGDRSLRQCPLVGPADWRPRS